MIASSSLHLGTFLSKIHQLHEFIDTENKLLINFRKCFGEKFWHVKEIKL